jgi:Xaa-Pro aminopeptidase
LLNVHEGPQVFNPTNNPVPIELGMITSVEPGIYRPGKHGIRIENLVNTITAESNEFNDFYAFESLTMAPINTSIIQKDLLEHAQVDWLNKYHELVYERLSPHLTPEEQAWLREETRAI